jgi:hypothetical protein
MSCVQVRWHSLQFLLDELVEVRDTSHRSC